MDFLTVLNVELNKHVECCGETFVIVMKQPFIFLYVDCCRGLVAHTNYTASEIVHAAKYDIADILYSGSSISIYFSCMIFHILFSFSILFLYYFQFFWFSFCWLAFMVKIWNWEEITGLNLEGIITVKYEESRIRQVSWNIQKLIYLIKLYYKKLKLYRKNWKLYGKQLMRSWVILERLRGWTSYFCISSSSWKFCNKFMKHGISFWKWFSSSGTQFEAVSFASCEAVKHF